MLALAGCVRSVQERDRHLRDLVVSLAEDNQTVMVYANWSDDAATLVSSFTLSEPMAAEDFDANNYRKLLES